jgi:hypothetical protein
MVLSPAGFIVSHIIRFPVLGDMLLLVTLIGSERHNLVIRPPPRITHLAANIPCCVMSVTQAVPHGIFEILVVVVLYTVLAVSRLLRRWHFTLTAGNLL